MENETETDSFQVSRIGYIFISVTVVAIGLGLIIIIPRIQHAIRLDPGNFRAANDMFFDGFDSNVIAIYDASLAEKHLEIHAPWTLEVRPIDLGSRGVLDRRNMQAHLNKAVLVFACKEMLKGDKQLGLLLLGLLQTHDPQQRYNYSSGKKAFGGGYENAYITLDELHDAATMMLNGDDSERALIEKPASQWDYLQTKFGYHPTE